MMKFPLKTCTALAAACALAWGGAANAASHREAPLIAQDPAADITDVYAFVNYNDPNKATFILNVIPAQEPSSGPNYFSSTRTSCTKFMST